MDYKKNLYSMSILGTSDVYLIQGGEFQEKDGIHCSRIKQVILDKEKENPL